MKQRTWWLTIPALLLALTAVPARAGDKKDGIDIDVRLNCPVISKIPYVNRLFKNTGPADCAARTDCPCPVSCNEKNPETGCTASTPCNRSGKLILLKVRPGSVSYPATGCNSNGSKTGTLTRDKQRKVFRFWVGFTGHAAARGCSKTGASGCSCASAKSCDCSGCATHVASCECCSGKADCTCNKAKKAVAKGCCDCCASCPTCAASKTAKCCCEDACSCKDCGCKKTKTVATGCDSCPGCVKVKVVKCCGDDCACKGECSCKKAKKTVSKACRCGKPAKCCCEDGCDCKDCACKKKVKKVIKGCTCGCGCPASSACCPMPQIGTFAMPVPPMPMVFGPVPPMPLPFPTSPLPMAHMLPPPFPDPFCMPCRPIDVMAMLPPAVEQKTYVVDMKLIEGDPGEEGKVVAAPRLTVLAGQPATFCCEQPNMRTCASVAACPVKGVSPHVISVRVLPASNGCVRLEVGMERRIVVKGGLDRTKRMFLVKQVKLGETTRLCCKAEGSAHRLELSVKELPVPAVACPMPCPMLCPAGWEACEPTPRPLPPPPRYSPVPVQPASRMTIKVSGNSEVRPACLIENGSSECASETRLEVSGPGRACMVCEKMELKVPGCYGIKVAVVDGCVCLTDAGFMATADTVHVEPDGSLVLEGKVKLKGSIRGHMVDLTGNKVRIHPTGEQTGVISTPTLVQ
jgi:hypothetical protein